MAARKSAARKTAKVKVKRITPKQKSARRKNIAVARTYKKKAAGKKKAPLRGSKRKSGMSARMEHELHRFTTMNDSQLTRRLGKIRNKKKLESFIKMAKWTGKRKLGKLAKARMTFL